VEHLVRTTPLPPPLARRVVEEVVSAFSEPVDELVRRRHRELKRSGLTNEAIFSRIASELTCRPVAAPTMTERQLRRAVYG
jgi:hypothetical protein